MMIETRREADSEALCSEVTMRREGKEWNGRSELSTSFTVESEEAAMRGFLSQKAAERWT